MDRTLYGALQVLDGVTPPIGNQDLDIEFVLTARVSDRVTGKVIDEIELGPNGEGLCGLSRVGRRELQVGARLRLAFQSSTYLNRVGGFLPATPNFLVPLRSAWRSCMGPNGSPGSHFWRLRLVRSPRATVRVR